MNQTLSEKINNLTDDELCLLYGIINYVPPKILTVEIPLSLICSIKYKRLKHRLMSAKVHIKPEFNELYDGLLQKI
jgi:hypothetical protein